MSTETLITEAAPAAAAPATEATAAAPAGSTAAPAPDAPAAVAPAAASADAPADAAAAEQTPEQKAAADAATKAAAGAPEKYENFAAPDGAELDPAVMDEFATAARELNLPQEAAQKMIDKMAPMIAKRQAEQLQTARTDWANQAKADPEYGGAKLESSMVHAKQALTKFGTPEFTELLDQSGLGNHPEVIRFMVKAGKALAEDSIVTGGQPASTPLSHADRLYGAKKA